MSVLRQSYDRITSPYPSSSPNLITDLNLQLETGYNQLVNLSSNLEMSLRAGLSYCRITCDLDQSSRRIKIVSESGVTIDGLTDNFIITGTQSSEYVLLESEIGSYILIAQSGSTFEVEGQTAGAVASMSVFDAGSYFDTFGSYPQSQNFIQVSSSGVGFAVEGSVTLSQTDNIFISSIDSITIDGSNYQVGELITVGLLTYLGTEITPGILRVDSVS